MVRHIKAYDFDGTLIKGDSFLLFPLYALSPVRLLKGIVKSLPVLFAWKVIRRISSSEAKERMFGNFYRGYPLDKFRQKASGFADCLDKHINKFFLDSHSPVDSSVYTVIVSASPAEWIRPWSERHGFDEVIATEVEVKDGVLTGAFATPNCKGEEKVVRLRKRFPSLADTLIEAWGDSADDIPMLTQADVAHCVGHLNSRDIDSARNKN